MTRDDIDLAITALLKSIVAEPASDLNRLALADAIDEQYTFLTEEEKAQPEFAADHSLTSLLRKPYGWWTVVPASARVVENRCGVLRWNLKSRKANVGVNVSVAQLVNLVPRCSVIRVNPRFDVAPAFRVDDFP